MMNGQKVFGICRSLPYIRGIIFKEHFYSQAIPSICHSITSENKHYYKSRHVLYHHSSPTMSLLAGQFRTFSNVVKDNEVSELTDEEEINRYKIDNLSPDDKRKLKILQLEFDVFYSSGIPVPASENMTNERWLRILDMPTISARRKNYNYWRKNDHKTENRLKKKAMKLIFQEEKEAEFRKLAEEGNYQI